MFYNFEKVTFMFKKYMEDALSKECLKLITTQYRVLTNLEEQQDFWKHFGKKEKMLVTSIFSFSHNVFYLSQSNFQWLIHIYFVVCKCFQFGPD